MSQEQMSLRVNAANAVPSVGDIVTIVSTSYPERSYQVVRREFRYLVDQQQSRARECILVLTMETK